MRNLPENIRRGFMRAKSLRIAAISRPKDLSGLNLGPNEKIDSDDYVTTYMLKTSLMFLHQQHKDILIIMEQCEFDWSEMILKKVVAFVRSRNFPTYYGDGVLFQCGDHADDDRVDRVCCQKRALILRLCDVIVSWLHDNKAELRRLERLHSSDWRLMYESVAHETFSGEVTQHESIDNDDSAIDAVPAKRQRVEATSELH